MAQADINARNRVTRIGLETTFGTTPADSFPNAMTSGIFMMDDVGIEPQVEMLEVNDEHIRREHAITPVQGLKIASKFTLSQYLKAVKAANQLTATGSVGNLTARILLRAGLGVEHAALGTTVNDSSATTTSFIATSLTTLKKGTFITVTISGTPEWTEIVDLNSGTSTVTVSPALSSAPANGAIVRNLYNACPKEAHTESLTIMRGWRSATGSDVTCEYVLNGCYGELKWKMPAYGQLPSMEFSGTAVNHAGPAASGSIDTATVVVDEMGRPTAWRPSVYLATSPVRGTRLPCETVEIAHANKWEQIRDGGAEQTVVGVLNTGGRPRATTAKIVCRYDQAWDTAFSAETPLRLIVVLTSGTGATTSFWIWEIGLAKLIAKPKPIKVGDRLHMELMLGGEEDLRVTDAGETDADDLSRIYATCRVAYG